jgi:hypothetical protein
VISSNQIKFSAQFREKLPADILPSIEKFEEISLILSTYSNQSIVWQPPVNLDELLDHYLDTLLQVYLYKYYVFSTTLIQVLNEENYLLYGLICRAIIEHTSVLRYYVTGKMLPLAQVIVEDGIVTQEELQELINWLDKHLTGRRFNWDNFFDNYEKKIEGIKPHDSSKPSQVNVITCLEKWGKENSSIINLYELFCDLVHPNLGSTILITRLVDHKLSIGGEEGEPMGRQIFHHTFTSIVELFQDIEEQLKQLQTLKFAEILRHQYNQ